MNKNILIASVAVIIVAVAGAYYFLNNGIDNTSNDLEIEDQQINTTPQAENNIEEENSDNVVTFEVDSSNFEFSVTEMTVEEGKTVRIVLTNSGGVHDWVVDEFDAATKQISQGETDTIEFVASKVGEYEYYCSVGNHREQGMVGTLTVTETN